MAKQIRIGALQPGAVPVNVGVMNARRGVAEFGGGDRAAVIVKAVTPVELAAECFCALFAQHVGLNAPDCAIVHEAGQWLFASVDMAYPNLTQAFAIDPNNPDPVLVAAALAELAVWPGIGRLLAFDVLIKNSDRNPGNLLLDGSDFWLIDHARCMDAFPYNDVQYIFSLMKQVSVPVHVSDVRTKAVAAALTLPPGCHSVPLQEIAGVSQVSPFAPNFDTLISNRLTSLTSIVNTTL